ncbi:MAG TPA: ParB/RepB/Spo0J family partition protein [Pirellulales bacterium]|jgi:ParB family chromosome partitioning protein|nr:ParB/RepB/Spo0J family partition protein [Pirellulales bacterium]
MSKERRLGRGLEALLGRSYAEPQRTDHLALHVPSDDSAADGGASANASSESAGNGQLTISVHDIERNPFQPRREFDEQEIAALADSLTEHGLIQPILVRRVGERYQLIAGERRLRAAVKAGWMEVTVQLRDADDRQVAELAIVENLQRKDLNSLEKAASFEQYIERYQCTQEELAGRLNIDRSTIANLIRLLELPATVQDAIRSGAVSPGHARALLPLGDEREQVAFCQRIQAEGLSVRATEQAVQEQIQSNDADAPATGKTSRSSRGRGQNLAALEQELRESLGTKVSIRETAKGRGKIVIQFSTSEEFDRLRSLLAGQPMPVVARAG